MIIVKIIGGLGNQMFQYALGRRLAMGNKTDLKLDISGYADYKLHEYKLTLFNIREDIATSKEISCFRPSKRQLASYLAYKIREKTFPCFSKVIIEKDFFYNPEILNLNDGIYLEGNWQSEKYFQDISDTIREELQLKNRPDNVNEKTLEKINASNAVSLHIRRGDYISNPETFSIHGTLGMDYYIHALKIIEERVKNPEIFVFSDDIQWAKDNLPVTLPFDFMDYNSSCHDYEDLRLMRSCKHHIIANSSFSWWGAWLCENAGKIVIAPERWFTTAERDTKDLIPDGWKKI